MSAHGGSLRRMNIEVLLLVLKFSGAYATQLVRQADTTPTSIIWATWVGAMATTGLLILALITAIFAILAFGKQSRAIRILQDQVDDQRLANKQQADVLVLQGRELEASFKQRRRAQAAQVFVESMSADHSESVPTFRASIRNSSSQPIHDLVVRWIDVNGAFTHPELHANLMPGEAVEKTQRQSIPTDKGSSAMTVWFRDADNQCWQTTDRGELSELCGDRAPQFPDWCQFDRGHAGEHSWVANPRGIPVL